MSPPRRSRLLALAAACCVTSTAAWAGPGVPENGTPLRLICVEDGQCGPSGASDVIRGVSYALGAVTGALFLVTDGATFRLALEAPAGVLAAVGVDALSALTAKRVVGRARPYTYSQRYPAGYSQHDIDDSFASFYSGHTSQTAVMLFSAATTLTLYHKRGLRWRILSPVMYAVAVGGTMAVGELRVQAGKHFYSDVLAGGLLGALYGIGIPVASYYFARMLRKDQRKVGVALQPMAAGLQAQGWF